MQIRPLRCLLALGILSSALLAGTASAAEYTTLELHIDVNKPVDEVWKKVGGYCDISAWLKMTCEMTAGKGELGSVRRLNNSIDEIMVAKTAHSYTYTQPNSPILYHGTLEVVPNGGGKSRINYSLFWDDAPAPDQAAKTKARESRTKAFTGALENMKKLAEGG